MVGIHNVTVDGCLLRRQQHMISVPVKKHILFAVYTMMTGDAGLGSGVAHTVTTPGDGFCFYIKHALLGANELATLSILASLLTRP